MRRAASLFAVPAAFFAVAGLLGNACRKQGEGWKGSFERRGGIIIVKNPLEPLYPAGIFRLEKELSIGRAEGEKEYSFSRIMGMDVDDRGSIYALDRADACVRVFDDAGRFVRTIGRKGQGPGEIEMPVFVQITPRNELFLYDYANGRAVFYSLDGDLLGQKTGGRPCRPIKVDSRGNLVGVEIPAPPPLGGKVFRRYDPDFRSSDVIAKEEQGQAAVFEIGRPACFCCVLPDDRVVWGHAKEYALHVLDASGTEIRTIEKVYSPRRMTTADATRYKEEYTDVLKSGYRLEFFPQFPAFSGIFADDEGRIFVKTYDPIEKGSEKAYYDVFDGEGRYVARLPLELDLAAGAVWKSGKLYTIESDAEGFPVVVRYGVSWGK